MYNYWAVHARKDVHDQRQGVTEQICLAESSNQRHSESSLGTFCQGHRGVNSDDLQDNDAHLSHCYWVSSTPSTEMCNMAPFAKMFCV